MTAKELRLKMGLNQTQFWAKVGVTQSAASRYESGRGMPIQVAWAIDLVYGKRPLVTLAKLRGCKVADLPQ